MKKFKVGDKVWCIDYCGQYYQTRITRVEAEGKRKAYYHVEAEKVGVFNVYETEDDAKRELIRMALK